MRNMHAKLDNDTDSILQAASNNLTMRNVNNSINNVKNLINTIKEIIYQDGEIIDEYI